MFCALYFDYVTITLITKINLHFKESLFGDGLDINIPNIVVILITVLISTYYSKDN